MVEPDVRSFAASLGDREKLLTYAVGFGVGLGLPVALSLLFFVIYSELIILLLPLPFLLALSLAILFRPSRFEISPNALIIQRAVGLEVARIEEFSAVHSPAKPPVGFTARIFGVDGIFGTFGLFWNREWGWFRSFVTDHRKQIELVFIDGKRMLLSPDDPRDFVDVIRNRAERLGLDVAIHIGDAS